MSHYTGKNLIISLDGTAIAAAKSCDINIQCATIPVSSPSDGQWAHSIPGLKSWSVTVNFLITLGTALTFPFVSSILRTGTSYTLRASYTSRPFDTLEGTAICKQCRITATIGNLLQGSFVFEGTTALDRPSLGTS